MSLGIIAATIGLIAASAFFVIIEFALLGARRHRLEEAALTHASARAALRGMNELTIMLAGAQLGITAATFALGAVTKPAVDEWLGPVFASWGAPDWLAGGAAFAVALLIVTFLHLVIGEMAPKSWAIAHPEVAARFVGIPSRVFVAIFRPFLTWANLIANRLVARAGVEPVDRAAVGGQDAETIRHLVEYSARSGTLDAGVTDQLTRAFSLGELTLAQITTANTSPTAVPEGATVADVRAAAIMSGHLRILLEASEGEFGLVHVRDTLLADEDAPASDFAREATVLDATVPVYEALKWMRENSVQFALVRADQALLGVVTLADVIQRVLPADDDTVLAPQ